MNLKIQTKNKEWDTVLNYLLDQSLFATMSGCKVYTGWDYTRLYLVLHKLESMALIKMPTKHTIKLVNQDSDLPAFHCRQIFLDGIDLAPIRKVQRFLKYYGIDSPKLADELLKQFDLGDYFYSYTESTIIWHHRQAPDTIASFSFIQKRRQP